MNSTVMRRDEILLRFPRCETLKSAISEIEKYFLTKGEVVCEISIDGMKLHESDEERMSEFSFDGISTLEVLTSSPLNLVVGAARSCREYLGEIRRVAHACAEGFRSGEISVSCRNFFEIVDAISACVNTLLQIRKLLPVSAMNTENAEFSSLASDWTQIEQTFLDMSRQLLEAFQKRDYVLIADLLEYELGNAIEGWLNILELSERAASQIDGVFQNRTSELVDGSSCSLG